MSDKRWIGIDIGGAYIKLADSAGWSHAMPFRLWKHPKKLAETLAEVLPTADKDSRYALTMTGELADCFLSRDEGVRFIVDAVSEAIESGGSLLVYTLDGELLCGAEAKACPDDVAAANWHCLATYASRFLDDDEAGLLIDIGSTTTDVIPVNRHGVATSSRSDIDRLMRSELLYFGVTRTPVCAVVQELPYRGNMVPAMAEIFATVDDCFLVLGRTEEAPGDNDSANDQPRTVEHAVGRIARMLGLDTRDFNLEDAQIASQYVEKILASRLQQAIHDLDAMDSFWILSGHGNWLVPSHARKLSLSDRLGVELSRAAPAYALACLAKERFG